MKIWVRIVNVANTCINSVFCSSSQVFTTPRAYREDSLLCTCAPLLLLWPLKTQCFLTACRCPGGAAVPLRPPPRPAPLLSRAPVSLSPSLWPWQWSPKTGWTPDWKMMQRGSRCPTLSWRGIPEKVHGLSEGLMLSWGENLERDLGSSSPLRIWRMAKVSSALHKSCCSSEGYVFWQK